MFGTPCRLFRSPHSFRFPLQVQLPAIGVVRNIACNHEGRKSSLVRTNFVERLLTTMKRCAEPDRL